MQDYPHPFALFDQVEYLQEPISSWHKEYLADTGDKAILTEYSYCIQFLLAYQGSEDTFKSYRRELERFCQWCWIYKQERILQQNRTTLTHYFQFVQNPPKSWISKQHYPRFDTEDNVRVPNPDWRPFMQRTNTKQQASKVSYQMSQSALRACMASISTFYTYLLQENHVSANPVMNIRQKSQFLQKLQQERITRKLSDTQWHKLVEVVHEQVKQDARYVRHRFLIAAFYLLGLRISELSETAWHHPKMSDFFRDGNDRWWFKTVGKGNKYREVAVPNELLVHLRDYRQALGLSALPTPQENTPLVPKYRGQGGIGTRQLRKMIQEVFDMTTESLQNQGHNSEADFLKEATVHWLRHTAISHDVQQRPREHVRDDAGHRSVSVTDRYIEIDLEARHATARNKVMNTNTTSDA